MNTSYFASVLKKLRHCRLRLTTMPFIFRIFSMANAKFEEGLKLAIPLLKRLEGWRGKAYLDQGGIVTIGYGFTKDVVPNLKMGDTITREKSDSLLEQVLRSKYATPLANAIKVWDDPKFSAKMFAALTSMIWQIGASMLRHDIIKKVNVKDYNSAANLIMQKSYTTAGGVVYPGLIKRRETELSVFKGGMTPDQIIKVAQVAAGGSGLLFLLIGGGIAGFWYLRNKKIEAVAVERQIRAKARKAKELAIASTQGLTQSLAS